MRMLAPATTVATTAGAGAAAAAMLLLCCCCCCAVAMLLLLLLCCYVAMLLLLLPGLLLLCHRRGLHATCTACHPCCLHHNLLACLIRFRSQTITKPSKKVVEQESSGARKSASSGAGKQARAVHHQTTKVPGWCIKRRNDERPGGSSCIRKWPAACLYLPAVLLKLSLCSRASADLMHGMVCGYPRRTGPCQQHACHPLTGLQVPSLVPPLLSR